MQSVWRFAASSLASWVLIAFAIFGSPDLYGQKRGKKNEEPKSQVLPLPPELPMVLAADTQSLDFHISPLLKSGGLAVQIRRSLTDLLRDTKGETIVNSGPSSLVLAMRAVYRRKSHPSFPNANFRFRS